MFKFNKTIVVSLVASALLVGCGSSSGSGSNDDTQSMSGVAIDGYVSGANVVLKNSSGEEIETTTTDANGDWNFEGVVIPDGSIVEVSGGTDTATGEVFEGVLKAPAATDGSEVVTTPLTTLVAALVQSGKSIDDAKDTVSSQLGISVDTLDADPIETLNSDTATDDEKTAAATAIKKALVIQKTAETLAKSVGGSDAAFDAVMSAVATKLADSNSTDGSGFDTIMANTTAIATAVAEDEEVAKDTNAAAKLKAVASSAQSIVTMINAMDVTDLTAENANVTEVLETKSKAMEVITSTIEEQAVAIAYLTDVNEIETKKDEAVKVSNALSMMGGVDGIAQHIETQENTLDEGESLDASTFTESFITTDVIDSNSNAFEELTESGFTSDMIVSVGTKKAEDTENTSIEDIIAEVITEAKEEDSTIDVDEDKAKAAGDAVVQASKDTVNQAAEAAKDAVIDEDGTVATLDAKVDSLLSPTKVATVADAKTLFSNLRDTANTFIDLENDDNTSTIVGSQKNDIDTKVVPKVEAMETTLNTTVTALDTSVSAFSDSLTNFDTNLELLASRFDTVSSQDMEGNWTIESGETGDKISHTYSNTDGTIDETITINGQTITLHLDNDELSSVSTSGAITLEDEGKYTLTLSSLSFADDNITLKASGTIYGDNDSSMTLTDLDIQFSLDRTQENSLNFIDNLEATFDGTIVSSGRTLNGKLTLSESDNTKNQLVGSYTGAGTEPSFEGTITAKVSLDDLKEVEDDNDKTQDWMWGYTLVMATPTDGEKSLVVKTTYSDDSDYSYDQNSSTWTYTSNSQYNLLTQSGDTISCDVNRTGIDDYTTNTYTVTNSAQCTGGTVEVLDGTGKIVTATVNGEEMVVDYGDTDWSWDSDSTTITPRIDFVDDDKGPIYFDIGDNRLEQDGEAVNITNITMREPSSVEEYNGELSFVGELTHGTNTIKGELGVRNLGYSNSTTYYAKDILVSDGSSSIKADELNVAVLKSTDAVSIECYDYSPFENYTCTDNWNNNYYEEDDSINTDEFTSVELKNLALSVTDSQSTELSVIANLNYTNSTNTQSVFFDGNYSYGDTSFYGKINISGDETQSSFDISGDVESNGFEPFTLAVKADTQNDVVNGYAMLTRGDSYKLGLKLTETATEDGNYTSVFNIGDSNGVIATYTDTWSEQDDNTEEDSTSIIFTDKDGNELATYGEDENENDWEIKYSDDSAETLF
ncbi:MAG: hypothetical protein U9O56_05470 [Campylobacterota bacterium]|nr:hypothetical protein [Campylobacterota bacterium]